MVLQRNPPKVFNGFTYVGLLFTTKLSLNKMVTDLSVKGKRILTSKLSSLHAYGVLSKESFLKIFDIKISSQLLYGAEVWGLKRYECLERIQTCACKRYMNLVKMHAMQRCLGIVTGFQCIYRQRNELYNTGLKY